MKVTVFVTPKKNVLDPQGAAIEQAIENLGLKSIQNVRVGRVIDLEIDGEATPALEEGIDRICRKLLCNTVIEDYRFEVEKE